MATIYRKYRPQNFQEIVGQDQVVQILRKAVVEGRFSHAYLFTGPRGCGKTSMARILCKAVNCLKPSNGDACNLCSSCLAINQGRFMDLIEIDAASNRGIDEIRELKEGIGFLPSEGKRKVYIIDEVHMLTEPAFNALLKTLEEPPKEVMFILATTEPHKLPLTIISRTQRFDFRLADDLSLQIKLAKILADEGISLSAEALNLIIKAGQGSFRDAETILEKVLATVQVSEKQTGELSKVEVEKILGYVSSATIDSFLEHMINSDLTSSLEVLDVIYKQGANLPQFTKECLEESRKLMLQDISLNGGKLKKLLQIIKEFNQASQEIKSSLIAVLPLELAVLNICAGNEEPEAQGRVANVVKHQINHIVKPRKPVEQPVKESTKEPVANAVDDIETASIESNAENNNVEILQSLETHWAEILDEAKKHNHFLTAILSGSKFIIGADDKLVLTVKSSFHKKQLENSETSRMLTKIISTICGMSFGFTCIINKDLLAKQTSKSSNADLVESILF